MTTNYFRKKQPINVNGFLVVITLGIFDAFLITFALVHAWQIWGWK